MKSITEVVQNLLKPYIDGKIETLTTQVEKKDVSQRHIVIVGDSYSDTDPTDFAYIIRDSGIFRQVDLSVGGGRGFTGKEGAPGDTGWEITWLRFFQIYVNGLSDEEKKDIDAVYIIGGFNDHYSTETVILNKMSEFFTWAHEHLKTRYYLIQTGWCIDHGDVTTPNETRSAAEVRSMLGGKVTKCYSQAARFRCTYLGTTIGALHDYCNDWMSDGYHPSEVGSQKLARAVLGLMLEGKMPLIRDFTHIYANGEIHRIGQIEIYNETLYFKAASTRFFAYATSNGSANSNLILDTSIASDTRYIASNYASDMYIPCTLQMPDDSYYSTFVYFNADGSLSIIAPCAITTTQRLRIRLMDTTMLITNC